MACFADPIVEGDAIKCRGGLVQIIEFEEYDPALQEFPALISIVGGILSTRFIRWRQQFDPGYRLAVSIRRALILVNCNRPILLQFLDSAGCFREAQYQLA